MNLLVGFCGSSELYCDVVMRDMRPFEKRRKFIAFRSSYECGKYKEKPCHWQLFKDHVKHYNPKVNKYEYHKYL